MEIGRLVFASTRKWAVSTSCLLAVLCVGCLMNVHSQAQSTRGKDLPSLEGMTQYGCTFMPLSNGHLRVDVWIDFDDEHPPVITIPNFPHRGFVSMLSERAGKTAQAQAEKDCLKWRASVSKSVVKSKPKEEK